MRTYSFCNIHASLVGFPYLDGYALCRERGKPTWLGDNKDLYGTFTLMIKAAYEYAKIRRSI